MAGPRSTRPAVTSRKGELLLPPTLVAHEWAPCLLGISCQGRASKQEKREGSYPSDLQPLASGPSELTFRKGFPLPEGKGSGTIRGGRGRARLKSPLRVGRVVTRILREASQTCRGKRGNARRTRQEKDRGESGGGRGRREDNKPAVGRDSGLPQLPAIRKSYPGSSAPLRPLSQFPQNADLVALQDIRSAEFGPRLLSCRELNQSAGGGGERAKRQRFLRNVDDLPTPPRLVARRGVSAAVNP